MLKLESHLDETWEWRFEHGGNDGSANNSHWHRGSRPRCGREALVGEFWHERVSADGYRGRGNSERLSFAARDVRRDAHRADGADQQGGPDQRGGAQTGPRRRG